MIGFILAIAGAIACLAWIIWLKIQPREYENCVLKPRGFHWRKKITRDKSGK